MPLPSLADLQLSPDEPVQVAGMVQSMLEGMIVVKVRAHAAPLCACLYRKFPCGHTD
jgi:hypothetical protein